jgi:hypothetical protein
MSSYQVLPEWQCRTYTSAATTRIYPQYLLIRIASPRQNADIMKSFKPKDLSVITYTGQRVCPAWQRHKISLSA